MFNVFVNNGEEEMPADDILYIVCKEGVYLKKKLGIMESITPVTNISVLESVQMMATMHIKPIPGTLFSQIIAFFKAVYAEYKSEAIVLLFYSEEKKTYKLVPPHQKVTAAGVDYNRAITMEGYTMIGDVHSHANFSAFHSGTDDADEKSFDGLHITIGNNGDDEVSLSASIVSNGQRFIIQAEDYVNKLILTKDIDEEVEKPYSTIYKYDHTTKKMVPQKSTRTYTVKRFDKRYVSTVSRKYQTFPKEWMELVEKGTYTWRAANRWGYQGVANYYNHWNQDHYDPTAWADKQKRLPLPAVPGKPSILPTKCKAPITFPPHTQSGDGAFEQALKDEFNPCEACPFKEHKLDWAFEQLMDEEFKDDSPSGSGIDWYECDKCKVTFSTEEDADAVCPECGVDEHLILMDPEEDGMTFEENLATDLDWYRCTLCQEVFNTLALFPKCPTCNAEGHLLVKQESAVEASDPHQQDQLYNFICRECGTEADVLNHGKCCYCGGDVLTIQDKEVLNAAIEEDSTMEKLPIPDAETIPITPRKKPGIFGTLFRKDRS